MFVIVHNATDQQPLFHRQRGQPTTKPGEATWYDQEADAVKALGNTTLADHTDLYQLVPWEDNGQVVKFGYFMENLNAYGSGGQWYKLLAAVWYKTLAEARAAHPDAVPHTLVLVPHKFNTTRVAYAKK